METVAGGNILYPKVMIGGSRGSVDGSGNVQGLTFTIAQLNQFKGGARLRGPSSAKTCANTDSSSSPCTMELRNNNYQFCLECTPKNQEKLYIEEKANRGITCEAAVSGNYNLVARSTTTLASNIYYDCEAYQYLSGGQCSPCDSTCVACSDSGRNDCQACDWNSNQYIGNNGRCKDCDLEQGNIFGTCLACPRGCTSCPLLVCHQCQKTETFSRGSCCPKNKYFHSRMNWSEDGRDSTIGCRQCSSSCSTCIGTNSNNCLSCPENEFLNPMTFVCGTTCETTNGYYKDTMQGACMPCIYGCKECSDSSTCTKCDKSNGYFLAPDKTCITCATDAGKFISTSGDSCLDCESNCLVCDDATTCKKCDVSKRYYLNGADCALCPSGSTISSAGNSCLQNCGVANCLTCGASASVCQQCDTNNGYYLNSGQCSLCQIKQGKYLSTGGTCEGCEDNCLECSDGTTCTKCNKAGGFYLSNADCLACDLKNGKFIPSSGNACSNCESHCLECTSSTACTKCKVSEGYFLSSGNCIFCDASQARYITTDGDDCMDCEPNCLRCSDGQTCTKCDSSRGFYLSNKDCLACDLKNGKFVSTAGDSCLNCGDHCMECGGLDSCTKCKKDDGYYLSGGGCLSCPLTNGKYISQSGDSCLDCGDGCLRCSDSTTCSRCNIAGGFYLSGGRCLSCKVSEGKFIPPSGDSCQDCVLGCSKCSNLESCSICDTPNGYVLESQTCVFCNTSSNNFIDQAGSPPTCKSCSKNCEKCTSKTNCTQCSQDYQVNSKGACVEKPSSIESYTLLQALPSDTDDEADFKLKVNIPGSGKFGSQLTYDTFKPPNTNPRELFKVEASSQTPAVGSVTTKTRLTDKKELIILGNFSTSPTSKDSGDPVTVGLEVTVLVDNIINKKPGVGLETNKVSASVKVTPQIEKKAVEAAAAQGQAISGASSTSSSAAVGASVIFSALGGDPTGLMIKFNQYLDFIGRLRLININFGAKLEAFLGSVGEMKEIKAETDEEKDDLIKAQNGNKGKLNIYFVRLEFHGRLMYKSGFFLLSWGVKLIGVALFAFVTARPQKINKLALYWIFWSRKIHILVMGTTMTDICFYGVRILLHSNHEEIKRHPIKFMVSTLSVALVVLDLIQIFHIVVHLKEKPPKPKTGTKEEDLAMDSAKQPIAKKNQILSRPSRTPIHEAVTHDKDPNSKGERDHLVAKVIRKEVHKEKTMARIKGNQAIKLFSIADLTPTDTVFVSKVCLLNNYFSIMKMAVQQMIMASLPHLPSFQISLILGAQILDMVVNIYQFSKRRHLKSWIKMILRVSSAFFISLFLIIALYIRVTFGTKALYIEKRVQNIASIVVMGGVGVEYLLTFTLLLEMMIVTVKGWMNKKKIKKIKEREELRGKEDGEVYSVIEIKDPICYTVTKRAVNPLSGGERLDTDFASLNARSTTTTKKKSKKFDKVQKANKMNSLSANLKIADFRKGGMKVPGSSLYNKLQHLPTSTITTK